METRKELLRHSLELIRELEEYNSLNESDKKEQYGTHGVQLILGALREKIERLIPMVVK